MDISVSMLGSLTSLSAGFDSPSSGTAQERGAVARAAAKINASGFLGADLEVSLAIDAQTRRPIVRVVDAVTHDVIEQIPPPSSCFGWQRNSLCSTRRNRVSFQAYP